MINRNAIKKLSFILDGKDIARLKASAEEANEIERNFKQKMEKRYREIEEKIEDSLVKTGKLPENIDFEDIIFTHAFETSKKGIISAVADRPGTRKLGAKKVKTKIPKGKMPRSLSGLMELWDKYRKTGKLPERQKKLAEGLKDAYLKKTQSVFEKYSRDFRSGGVQEKREIIKKVKEAGRTTFARANTIVETETTKYYNESRRNYYDQSSDVTHYLFVAIRDMATTKWCKTRDGLVYEKGSKYLDKETPPIHWNCRSEVLPLTPQNPKHLKLIKKSNIQRKNRRPAPLPKGWSS